MTVSGDKLDEVFGPVTAVEQISKWREKPTPSPETVRPWDRNPIMMRVKGKQGLHEYFTIGAFAEALGRKTVTIRSWEDKGILPPWVGRLELSPEAKVLPGKTAKGRRMYTRPMIEAVIAAAKATGVYDPANAPNANWEEFTRLVRAAWYELLRKKSI